MTHPHHCCQCCTDGAIQCCLNVCGLVDGCRSLLTFSFVEGNIFKYNRCLVLCHAKCHHSHNTSLLCCRLVIWDMNLLVWLASRVVFSFSFFCAAHNATLLCDAKIIDGNVILWFSSFYFSFVSAIYGAALLHQKAEINFTCDMQMPPLFVASL